MEIDEFDAGDIVCVTATHNNNGNSKNKKVHLLCITTKEHNERNKRFTGMKLLMKRPQHEGKVMTVRVNRKLMYVDLTFIYTIPFGEPCFQDIKKQKSLGKDLFDEVLVNLSKFLGLKFEPTF